MTKTYLTGRRLLATFITLACAVAVTNIATAQVMSPNGKVEWKEKGKGFAIVYHNGGNEQEVLEIDNVGMLMKDGGGKELTLKAKMPVEAILRRRQAGDDGILYRPAGMCRKASSDGQLPRSDNTTRMAENIS